MPSQNYRTTSSASVVASGRVRALWQNFVRTSSGRRNATEHKIRAATDKLDEEAKAAITKDIREKHCLSLRSQWQTLLHKEGLNGAQWIDKTEEERDAVTRILGEFEDEDEVTAPSPISPPMAQAKLTSYTHPPAPSISSSTRSTNTSSASSYAFVNPSEFCSEDDQDEFVNPLMPTSNDTSDDEAMIQPIQFHPGRRGVAQNGWSSSESLNASLQGSVGSSSEIPFSRPLASGFAQNIPYGRMSSAKQSAASLQSEKAPAPKSKVVRQPYIGPRLEDPKETILEAEDFERFKMQTRMEKIIEFHQAAALAEIRLSFAIYRSRKAQDGERLEVSPLVLEHQKSMVQLQTAKEDERKTIVKTERSKRRSELRGRPGRSNTLMAPTPIVPLSTNPSWLNGIEGQLSSQLEPQFDINKLLSEDPDEQENSMQRMFGQIFPEPSSSCDNRSSVSANSFRGHEFSSQFAFQSGQGFSSASMQSGVPGRGGHSSQTHKRRPSDARVKNLKRGKVPSLFGENDSSDGEVESEEGDDDDDDNESPPAARNPFMNTQASDMSSEQWPIDFELQRSMAQFGLSSEAKPTPATKQSWGSSSRLMEQPPSAPAPSPWMASAAAKEVRSTATPVSSGWTRKNSVVPPPQPTYAFAPSFRNPFGEVGGQSEPSPPPPPSTMPTMTSAKAKGKQPMNANAPVEPQPIWGQPHKKPSPPIPAAPTDFFVPSVAPVAVPTPVPPQIEKPITPAPSQTPASASKKLNKKQRQAAKKGGPAVASSFVEESEPTPAHFSPTTQSVDFAIEEDPSYVTEPNPEPSMFSSSLSRMLPNMTRAKTDQAAGMNGFSSWDTTDPVSTPRPPSKVPAHFQEALLATSEDTPRPNQSKKNHLAELLSMPLNKTAAEHLAGTSTIRGPQWGSAAATNAPTKSLWNMFTSEPVAVPKPGDPQVPGGFGWNADGGDDDLGDDDGSGEDEVETMSQSFWQPQKSTGAPINTKSTSVPAQKTAVPTQGLRRVSEAPSPALPPPAPPVPAKVVTPVIQPQSVPAFVNKKGKGKKGKGKKVTIEEVPDDDADKNIDHLPVDSKVILEPSNSSNDTPNQYDLIHSFRDEEDVLLSTPSSFAATPSTAASSPPDLFGGAQAWLPTASAKETANIGWGAAKPVAWNPSVGTDTESQTPLWGRALQPKQQQTPVWGQTSNKDKGKGKQTDLEQGSKVVNPTVQNLKRGKPSAGGKLF